MAKYQRREIVPGLFVLAAVLGFALAPLRVRRWGMVDFLQGPRVPGRPGFAEVKTLAIGAQVAVAGRRVGAVSRLRWPEQPYAADDIDTLRRQLGTLPDGIKEGARRLVVEVDFDLTDATLRLDPISARVAILQDGFLGQHFLDLYPGYWEADREPKPVLAAEHPQPLPIRARRAIGFDSLAATAGDAITSMNTLAKTLNDGVFSAENRESLTALLKSLNGVSEDLRRLIGGDGEDGLRAATIQPLRELLDSATATLAQVRETTLPRTDQLLDESRAGVQDFRAVMATVQRDLIAVLDQLEGALVDMRPELAESVRRLRSTLWQAEMAMRKVRGNPSLLLFGSEEEDLEAREIDESGLRASGRARIYRQRDEATGGR